MEMPLNIEIEKLYIKVKVAEGRRDDIKAFGEMWIHPPNQVEPIFKVKGFTIRLKEFSGKKVLTVVFPAFRAGKSFQTSFITEDKSLLADIRKLFLDEFGNLTGGLSADELASQDSNEITEEDWDKIG